MSVFSEYLPEWESFYIKICDTALDSANKLTEEKMSMYRDDFYHLYASLSGLGLSECELAAFMIVALSNTSSVIAMDIARLQKQRGRRSDLPDYSLITILNQIYLYDEDIRPGLLLREDSLLNSYFISNSNNGSKDITMDIPLSLNKGIASWLLGEEYSLGDAGAVVSLHHPDNTEEVIAHDAELEELTSVFVNMNAIQEKGIIHMRGSKGCGKCFMVKAMSKLVQMPLLIVDVRKLFSFDINQINEMVMRTITKCYLDGGILYLDFGAEERYDAILIQRLFATLQRFWGVVIAGSVGGLIEDISITGSLHVLNIENPTKTSQRLYWEYFAGKSHVKLDDEIDLDALVSAFDLTPGRIKRAVNCARDLSVFDTNQFIISKKVLYNEIRKICAGHFSELATKLLTPFGWDDLKASDKTKSLMKEAINRIRYKSVVNEEYGFAKLLPYGQGLSVAFFGPPGTGKTMAATVMAKELGLDIYRIDLSQISSKYIGESEKNLSAVFDSAKYSNAILFFDEADALFARRTDVSSSNDKHANSETAFLLQKMEEYTGICILATNVIQNFDAAFKRRITYMIPVEKPTEAERLLLWESVFPKGTPLAEDVNFTGYAKASELSGAEIKSAAIRAAYMAASENRPVSNMDIAVAIDEEYKKTGHISILPQLIGASTGASW